MHTHLFRPLLASLLLLAACGREVPRDSMAARRAEREAKRASQPPDTAVFVARQAGEPEDPASSVMQLRVSAGDAQVAILSGTGQQAVAGAVGVEPVQEIPGSRSTTVDERVGPPPAPPAWRADVTVPVLTGERYLVELYPSTPRLDSALVELSADGETLLATRVAVDASSGEPALFEVAIAARTIHVGAPIERVEIVPTCGLTHVVRSGSRASLHAEYEVVETGEHGDVQLLPRAEDAAFRSVTFRTWTRGTVRLIYLGHVLATAALPEGCVRD